MTLGAILCYIVGFSGRETVTKLTGHLIHLSGLAHNSEKSSNQVLTLTTLKSSNVTSYSDLQKYTDLDITGILTVIQ